jgi:hypothetical protein
MAEETDGFKRVNFFTGFQTTAEDWNDLVSYDVEKHKLHNRLFHAPGVLSAELGGLKISARGRGDLSVEVASGRAMDGEGNDLYLSEASLKTLDPADFKLPQTVYVVLKYVEDLTDFVSYRANLEYKGHRRISEQVKIDVLITEPDILREVELCRIALTKGVKRITDAKDPSNPTDNEIDLRFVPRAGVVGSRLAPSLLHDLGEMLGDATQIYAHMFHNLKILTASDVLHALHTLEMLRRVNAVDRQGLFDLFGMVFELQAALISDVESNYPQYSSKKEFASFKKHVELLEGNYNEGVESDEFVTNIVGYQRKSNENLQTLFGGKLKTKKTVRKAPADAESIFEKIKVRSDEFGAKLDIDGIKLTRIDVIDVLNKRSEADHKFRIVDARDRYRTRQKLKYPDGVIIEDVGIAFEGGYAEFEVSNVVPNKDLIMVQRMDYVHGEWEAEFHVNGKKVGTWSCAGGDRKFRWRNWPFKVPAEYVTDTFLTIKVVPVTADRDLNIFQMWFYQPK